MTGMRPKKDERAPKITAPQEQGCGTKLEWSLLVYPALFLITLLILYFVNQSIEKQMPIVPAQAQTTWERRGTAYHLQQSARAPSAKDDSRYVEPASPPATEAERRAKAVRAIAHSPARQGAGMADRSRPAVPADAAEQPRALDQLQGPDRIVAILQMAAGEKDFARIKECLDELVALGDNAVVPLNDLIGEEGEAALWAAEALARIGTPLATSVLLDTLSQTKEGPYKEELGKRVAGITNHDSWPLLLDSILQTGDATVLRAAGASLSMMADTPVVDAIVAYYDAASTEAEIERLTQLVGSIQSPKATEALLALAGNTSSLPQDSLQKAAVEALVRVGDPQCVSHLLRRLEAAPPGEGAELFSAITRINRPEAQTALLYAAAGNKEVSAESGRTAAIYALKNYPTEQTLALLERIVAQEDNDKVRAAATRTLDDIKQAPHLLTAKADSLVKEDYILPPLPEKK